MVGESRGGLVEEALGEVDGDRAKVEDTGLVGWAD